MRADNTFRYVRGALCAVLGLAVAGCGTSNFQKINMYPSTTQIVQTPDCTGHVIPTYTKVYDYTYNLVSDPPLNTGWKRLEGPCIGIGKPKAEIICEMTNIPRGRTRYVFNRGQYVGSQATRYVTQRILCPGAGRFSYYVY